MQLVTIAIFPTAFSAHVIQGRLQADGIECYVQDEHSVQMTPMFSNAIGGIKLQVKEEDVQIAVALLRQSGYRTVFDAPPVTPPKEQHILLRFIKFLAAAVILLAWLYFAYEYKGKI